ncbi:hypothetical protein M885DRAFT_587471 [Pelagophyceae sp. CCMP2097]|nr:hypothetical protein M885DRAFT_587471 [Pelagophyceae sp. CCMP2097]|mmetsp:Transcript_6124/g.19617  ORF Transcript_6124/g.19617 Transcript_6124/m.19617 type:complete len:317 (-) Transcript_6124:28-978(-)
MRIRVLTDSASRVSQLHSLLTQAVGLESIRAPVRHAWGSSAAAALGGGGVIEVAEIEWVSKMRSLRRAPPLGALVSAGADSDMDAAAPWAVAGLRGAACWNDTLALPFDQLFASTETAPRQGASQGVALREVVLSCAGAPGAAALRERLASKGFTRTAPGVVGRFGLDVRLQPLQSDACAIVLKVGSVDEAALRLVDHKTVYDIVGRSGHHVGQLALALPWARGLGLRLCEKEETALFFNESHAAIFDDSTLPELQADGVTPGAATTKRAADDCWMEVRTMLKRPGGFFRKAQTHREEKSAAESVRTFLRTWKSFE